MKFIYTLIILLIMPNLYADIAIQTWTSNHAQVYYLQDKNLPIIDIRILFAAGSAYDEEKHGIAALTHSLLSESANGNNAQTIAANFANAGARFSGDINKDMAWLSLRSLNQPKYLQPALKTFIEVISQPDFLAKDFELLMQQTLIGLKLRQQSPGNIARDAFYKALYQEHPYAHRKQGSEETLALITLQDIKNFYKKYYVTANAKIIIIGDIEKAQAKIIADNITQTLTQGQQAPEIPQPKPITQNTIYIPHPSTQTHIYIGQLGVKRGDPEYFNWIMGNEVLGGSGFSSRLMQVIREDNGLAYSIYSIAYPQKQIGPFYMAMQTRTEQTEQAIQLLKAELHKFLHHGVTEKELQHAKKYKIGSFPLNISNNKQLLSYISMIAFYNMPLSYLNDFTSYIDGVSQEDILKTYQNHVDENNLITVIVGSEK